MYTYEVRILQGQDLEPKDLGGTSDCYCICWIGSAKATTTIKSSTVDPVWNEALTLKTKSTSRPQLLIIDVKDRDRLTMDQDMGRIIVSLRQPSMLVEPQWFPVKCKSIKFTHSQGMIQLRVKCMWTKTGELLPDEKQWTRQMTSFMDLNNFNFDFVSEDDDTDVVLPDATAGEEEVQSLQIPFTNSEIRRNTEEGEELVPVMNPNAAHDAALVKIQNIDTPSTFELVSEPTISGTRLLNSEPPIRTRMRSTPDEVVLLPQPETFPTASAQDSPLSPDVDQLLLEKPDARHSVHQPKQAPLTKNEIIQWMQDGLIFKIRGINYKGTLIITNLRILMCTGCDQSFDIVNTPKRYKACHSMSIPFGLIKQMEVKDSRVHGGAFGGSGKAARLINIRCRDIRTVAVIFAQADSELGETVVRELKVLIKCNLASRVLFPPGYTLRPDNISHRWEIFDFVTEFKRQGIDNSKWRVSTLNGVYELCRSYPTNLWVPREIDDATLQEVFKFRSRGRIPALTYYYKPKQTSIIRCAQPMAGVAFRNCKEDEMLLGAVCGVSGNPERFVIFDCRSSTAATGNRFKGKGVESGRRYEKARILFMELANIHAMRDSIESLRDILEDSSISENDWLQRLSDTGWMQHIRSILSGAVTLAKLISFRGVSVVVHCSDGWDRTSQVCFLAQLLLDPYFRTIKGFQELIRKDFLAFGYKFSDRDFDHRHPNERSPVFFQAMEIVYHIMQQYPTSFEFSPDYLLFLIDHHMSGWFGNFLFNNERERHNACNDRARLSDITLNIWDVEAPKNPRYDPTGTNHVLMPMASLKVMRFFTDYFLRYDSKMERLKLNVSKEEHNFLLEQDTLVEPDIENWDTQSEMSIATDGRERNRGESIVIWQPNEDFSECSDCQRPFTMTRRKHHCRACGHIYCGRCLGSRIVLPATYGYKSPQKVCENCYSRFTNTRVSRPFTQAPVTTLFTADELKSS